MPSTILPLDWHPIRHVVLDFGGVLYRIDYTATANAFADLGFDDFLSLYAHSGQSRLMDDSNAQHHRRGVHADPAGTVAVREPLEQHVKNAQVPC